MSKSITKTGLTAKQELFCLEYAKDFNGTRAAIAAGYSKNAAAITGFQNLRKTNIQKRLAQLVNTIFADEEAAVKDIVRKLIIMADYDPAEMYDQNGNLKSIHDIPEKIRRNIQSIKTNRTEISEAVFTEVAEIKTPDRLKAVELLGRYLKMFTDIVEHKGNVTLEIRLASQDDGGNGKLLNESPNVHK